MNYSIELKDREINFESGEDLSDFDLQALLKIDYTDLLEETRCFPFVLNQINFLLIESKNHLNETKFQLDIIKDNLDRYKSEVYMDVMKELIDSGVKSPTITLIEGQISLKQTFIDLKTSCKLKEKEIARLQNQVDYMSSLYWSAKLKAEILINLSKSLNLNEISK